MDEQTAVSQNPTPQKTGLAALSVLTDRPLTEFEITSGQDAFDHTAFADVLLKLLTSNIPPLSVGLFGPWGIGKSTIVSILFSNIRRTASNKLVPIYFNAWKYSGDSFRRQFLLEVAQQLLGPDDPEIERLRQLNYTDVLKTTTDGDFVEEIAEAIRKAFRVRMALSPGSLARFFLGAVTLLCLAGIAALTTHISVPAAVVIMTVAAPAVFIWIAGLKFEDIIRIQEAPIVDPKLIFPEQFEEHFQRLLSSAALANKYAVIAIDDIDRCDAAVIKDILTSTKTFMEQSRCFFLVPCDDRTVVEVFRDPHQQDGYADESLRKYFNVSIRIPPITSTDLIDFANTVVRQTGISDEIVQIAILGNCRDARKMKHFLNTLAMKYNIAKAREAGGTMPPLVDDNILEFCKVVLIEDGFPDFYARVVENPRLCNLIEQAANGKDTAAELAQLGLSNWRTEYPGLAAVFQATRDISLSHAELFFSLKATNQEVRLPFGSALREAIITGDREKAAELALQVTTPEAGQAASDLVIELLRKATELFLHNALSVVLQLYSAGVFPVADRRRVAKRVLFKVLHDDLQRILEHKASELVECAQELDSSLLASVVTAILNALIAIQTEPLPPANLSETIKAIYSLEGFRAKLAEVVNKQYLTIWGQTGTGLAALEALHLPKDAPEDQQIPSQSLVLSIMHSISGRVPDDLVKRDIVLEYWRDDLSDEFGDILASVLKEHAPENLSFVPSDSASAIGFTLNTLIDRPAIFGGKADVKLWPLLRALHSQAQDTSAKHIALRTIAICCVFATDPTVKTSTRESTLAAWRSLNDEALRDELSYLLSLKQPRSEELLTSALTEQMTNVDNEWRSPTETTRRRVALCGDYAKYLPDATMSRILRQGLAAPNATALSFWIEEAKQHDSFLRDSHLAYVSECLALVGAAPAECRSILLSTFATQLGNVSNEQQTTLIDDYFDLLKNQRQEVRNAATEVIDNIKSGTKNPQDFKLGISKTITYLRYDVSPAKLLEHRRTLDSILGHSESFEYQWRDIADLARRSMAHDNTALQEYGIEIVARMDVIPEDDQADLVHLLIKLSKLPSTGAKALELIRMLPDRVRHREAADELTSFLANNSQ